MDYEKKDFRKLYEDLVKSDWFKRAYHNKSLGECPFDIPELAESEDERIGNIIYCIVRDNKEVKRILESNGASVDNALSYLEKQKDANKAIEAVERIDKYIDEHVANAHDMKDSNPDKKYYRGWDDALAKMSGILQDVYSGKKQKEQKPDTRDADDLQLLGFIYDLLNEIEWKDDWAMSKEECLRRLKFLPINLKKKNEDVAKLCSNEWSEEDQKIYDEIMSELEKSLNANRCYFTSDDVVFLKSFPFKLKKESEGWRHYIWATNLRFDFTALIKYDNTDNYEIVQAGNRPKQEKNGIYILIKDIESQPSWKPSAQELGALKTAVSVLTEERTFPNAAEQIQKIIDVFDGKELRKDWKPSEEQMEALKCVIADVARFSKRGGRQVELENEPYYSALHSLYCNLEKLI